MSIQDKIDLVRERISFDKNLSEEQLDFILHPILEPSYLKACPGSGKTEVVGIKAAYEIQGWTHRFTGLAILSFTKNAAKEISDRVKQFGGANSNQHPHFIGTIDSWLHSYILHPFGHKSVSYNGNNGDKSYRLVDNEENYDFLNPYKTILSYTPYKDVWVNDYYFECSENIDLQSQNRTLNLSGISNDIKNSLSQNKRKFLAAGFTTYADAEFLCYYLLKNNKEILTNVINRFPILVIDECQDLSHNQLEILKLLNIAGAKIHFVGDNNQSIYEFKKVYVEKIDQFISENGLTVKLLTRNFRSNQKIVDISLKLEQFNTGKLSTPIVGNEIELLSKSCVLWQYTAEEFPTLPQKFINYLRTSSYLIKDRHLRVSHSAILARAHNTLSEFKSHPISDLSKIELFANSVNCWANNPRTSKDMQNALQQLGKSICLFGYDGKGNHQHQYCPLHYNQIEWRQQLSDMMSKIHNPLNGIYPFGALTWSEWSGKLKSFLKEYWVALKSPSEWDSVKTKIKAPNGFASKAVTETFKQYQNIYSEPIRMTTFHDIKGETLDAALIVSSRDKKSKGGHFEHWISQALGEREYVRFAYVASSRPKHLLVWAIPKISKSSHLNKLMELGFEIE